MISWLKGKQNTITSAAAVVASFSVLSRFIGFIRDRILAGAFGAGDVLDVYFAAFRIPDLLFQLMVVGALSASFIPLFTKYFSKDKSEKSWELTNKILNLLIICFGVLILVAIIFINPLSSLIAPGFDIEKQESLAQMARIMFGAQFLLCISMVFGSVLQGAKNFFLYSLAPIFYNLGIITGVIFFVPVLGPIGLAWGVVFGALLHLITQWFGVKSLGYSYRPLIKIFDKDVKYTIKHMIPRVLGLAVSQLNFLLMTIIATTLVAGSVTVLQFAYNLNFFAVGIIGVSYAVASFPTLCELYNQKKTKQLVNTFSQTVRQMLLFLVPATVLFILLRAQIVRLVVGAGQFDWDATILTANTLGFFAITLIVQALVFLLVRMYFAQGNTRIPFIFGLIAAIVHVFAALFFSDRFGVVGLGIAYSIAVTIQFVLLWTSLRMRMGNLGEIQILRSLSKMVLAGLICGFSAQGMKYLVVDWIQLDTFWAVFAQLMIAGGIGLIVYILSAYALKSVEMLDFVKSIKARFLRKAKPEESIVTQM